MNVWLWDASGPEYCGLGVTDDEDNAIQIADALLQSGHATIVKVEKARLDLSIRTLMDGYERLGTGWRARAGASGIRWKRFTDDELAASLASFTASSCVLLPM